VSAVRSRLSLPDMMFLYSETSSTMMHVGGLLPFTPPTDAAKDHLRALIDDSSQREVVAPWNLKLSHPHLLYAPNQAWVTDTELDLDYHLRRSALASPGDERELGILISRLHSHSLDLTRPPWELHLIEGLEGGRFAMYIKIHHALLDGFTGMKVLGRSFSTDASERGRPLFFNIPAPGAEPGTNGGDHRATTGRRSAAAAEFIGSVTGGVRSAFDLTKAVVNAQIRRDHQFGNLTGSVQAPHCILNSPISRNRRFATQQFPIARLKAVGDKHGAKINDVALTMIGGGLRSFLADMNELPDKPLIAFLPVNVRAKDEQGGGNAVGAILASLGTDIADPVQRLEVVTESTRVAKAQLKTMTRNTILAYSAALMAPTGIQVASALTGIRPPWPFTFNLCVSNVPGPPKTLYLNGSRLEAYYPVSIPGHGMALNVTLHGYADTLDFGFIGCRDTLPHLQRLAVATGAELDALVGTTKRGVRRNSEPKTTTT
jgi:diacylglycerol O-acyltransferase